MDSDSIIESKPKGFFRRGFSLRRFVRYCVFTLLIVIIFFSFILFYVLPNNPLSSDRLRVSIATTLSDLSGNSVSIEDARLQMSGRLWNLHTAGIEFVDSAGLSLAAISALDFHLHPFSLLRGDVRIRQVGLSDGIVHLPRVFDSNYSVSGPDAQSLLRLESIDFSENFEVLYSLLSRGSDILSDRNLDSIELSNLRLSGLDIFGFLGSDGHLDHLTLVRDTRVPDADVSDTSVPDTSELKGLFIESLFRTDNSSISISGHWVRSPLGDYILDLSLSDISATEFFATPDFYSESKLSFNFKLHYSSTGDILPSSLDVLVSSGRLKLGEDYDSEIHSMSLKLLYDPIQNSFELLPSQVIFPSTETLLSGSFTYPKHPSDTTKGAKFNFFLDDLRTRLSDSSSSTPSTLRLEGFTSPSSLSVNLSKIDLQTPDGALQGSGELGFTDRTRTPSLDLDLSLDSISVQTFKQLWIPFIAPKLRIWAGDNIQDGVIKDAMFEIRFPSGILGNLNSTSGIVIPEDGLSLSLPFSGSWIKFLDDLPAFRSSSGRVEVTGTKSNIFIDSARLDIPDTNIFVTSSIFKLNESSFNMFDTSVDINLSSTVPDFIKLGELPTLDYAESIGSPSTDFSGNATADITATFVLNAETNQVSNLDWSGSGKIENGSLISSDLSRDFTHANLNLSYSSLSTKIEGDIRIDDHPAKLLITEHTDSTKPSERKLYFDLDESGYEKLGLENPYIFGEASVELSLSPSGNQHYLLDLTDGELRLPWMNWRKGRGVAGKVSFDLIQSSDEILIESLTVAGPDFGASGEMRFDHTGMLLSAELSDVSLTARDSFNVSLLYSDNSYDIHISGPSYDGRALIRSLISESDDDIDSIKNLDFPAISLRADFDTFHGFQGESINSVNVFYEQTGDRISSVRLYAQNSDTTPVFFIIRDIGDSRNITFTSENSGSTLRFLDIYENMDGGRIRVTLDGDSNDVHTGDIVLSNFHLINEPRLSQFLRTNDDNPALSDPNRVLINRATGSISLSPDSLLLGQGRILSDDVVAIIEGTVYDSSDNIDLSGTYLPGSELNILLSKIPILGLALLGDDGDERGILGFTFKLTGEYSDPLISVNPASIIAPGVFRDLFEFN